MFYLEYVAVGTVITLIVSGRPGEGVLSVLLQCQDDALLILEGYDETDRVRAESNSGGCNRLEKSLFFSSITKNHSEITAFRVHIS